VLDRAAAAQKEGEAALEKELEEAQAKVKAMQRRAKSAAVEASSDDSGGAAELESQLGARSVPLSLLTALVRALWQWGDRRSARRLLPIALVRTTAARAALARRAAKEAADAESQSQGVRLPDAVRLGGTAYGDTGRAQEGVGDPSALAAASVFDMHTRGTGAVAASILPSAADMHPGVAGASKAGTVQAASGAIAATGALDLGGDPTGDTSRPGSRAMGDTGRGLATAGGGAERVRLPAPSAILPSAVAERQAAEALARTAAELVLLRRVLAFEAATAECRARRGGLVSPLSKPGKEKDSSSPRAAAAEEA